MPVKFKISSDGGKSWKQCYSYTDGEMRFPDIDEVMMYCSNIYREGNSMSLILNEAGETLFMMAKTATEKREFLSLFVPPGYHLRGWHISAIGVIYGEITIDITFYDFKI